MDWKQGLMIALVSSALTGCPKWARQSSGEVAKPAPSTAEVLRVQEGGRITRVARPIPNLRNLGSNARGPLAIVPSTPTAARDW